MDSFSEHPRTDHTRRLANQPKVRCFGDEAALCAEASSKLDEGVVVPTVNLEVAPRVGGKVDWSRKINIELSETELPLVCAVGLGLLPGIRIERPGKAIDIQRQANKLYVRGFGENVYPLPVTMGNTFLLTGLLLSQLKKQMGMLDEGLILAALRGAAALYQDTEKTDATSGRNPAKSPRLR